MGSDTASRPANSPLMARCITLAPSERSSSACGIRDCTEIPNCSISAVLPKANWRSPTWPRTPIPEPDSKLSGVSRGRPRSCAAFTIASASGCSLPWSRLAAKRNTSDSSKPDAATTRSNTGRPSVNVPVLSMISVSILRRFSMAAASRNNTPWVAPWPVATMIDIGVAKPSAQGQAIMSTATALINA